MKLVLTCLALAALAYAALCLVVFLFQARLVYFPTRSVVVTPAALGLAFEEVWLEAADGVRLHGWFLPAEEPRGALLYGHGNGGNIADRMEPARAFRDMGLDVLLFDWRGYGRSAGAPTEAGLYRDGEAAWAWLVGRGVAPERIVLYGESLGGGVAVELARRHGRGVLLTESTFTSVPDVGAEVYPWLPVRLLARHRFDNLAKAADVRVPWLIVHSPHDEIVPFEHALRLFDAAAEPKRLLPTGGGHNDGGFLRRAEWRQAVRAFLDAHR